MLDFDLGESSDDSDFRIEDHCEESDDDSVDSNDGEKGNLSHQFWNKRIKMILIVFLKHQQEVKMIPKNLTIHWRILYWERIVPE